MHDLSTNRRQFIAASAGLLAGLSARVSAESDGIMLLYDPGNRGHRDIADGISKALSGHPVNTLDLAVLNTSPSDVLPKKAQMIVSIGDTAATLLDQHRGSLATIPRYYIGTSEALNTADHPLITRHSHSPDYEDYLQHLRALMPRANRIGILTSASDMPGQKILSTAAANNGFEIVDHQIDKSEQLTSGLTYLARRSDMLFGLPDTRIYNGQTARHILIFSLRQRLPLIGLSESWVRVGALFAQDWNYPALGELYGQFCLRHLTKPRATQPEKPLVRQATRYAINMRIAARFNIDGDALSLPNLIRHE